MPRASDEAPVFTGWGFVVPNLASEQVFSAYMDANDETQLRVVALQAAVQVATIEPGFCHSILERSEELYEWLSRRTPAHIRLTVGETTKQEEQQPMQIHDNEQFTVTIEVDDAKGFAIQGDQVTVTSADESVATVQDQGDGVTYLIVAGNPGSTVITFDAGTDDNGNNVSVTEAVDVVPGNVATVKLTEGTVTEQAAATAPTGGDAGTGDGTTAPTDGTGTTDTTTDGGTATVVDPTEGTPGASAV